MCVFSDHKGNRNSSPGSAAQRKNEPTADDVDNDADDWAFHNHMIYRYLDYLPFFHCFVADDYLDDHEDDDAFPRKSLDIESLDLIFEAFSNAADDNYGPLVRLTSPPSPTRIF
ncbi:hypothetical protein E3N88_31756 [Mikania micrantha]|uniref:Uncharacterized protein n=1 Tax=Mikania micrantha TaxID=192012 RepID=A0A5N6M732_9ASTR|nr:hypothetical protein E3N88_31756 [Mikania micrantha]